MFEGNFKDFKFNEQLDKTLDLTETVEKRWFVCVESIL